MSTTVTVTATFNDPSGSALQGNSFVRFRLRNYQGFIPRVSGSAVVCETQYDAYPNSSGQISQALIPNNSITPSTTFYTVEYYNQGRCTSSGNYIINGNTDLDTAAQLNTPPVPPGFELVLQNNGQDNSSQSTLNLECTDGTIAITDKGAGTLNLQGSPKTGPRPIFGNWHYWCAYGHDGVSNACGCSPETLGNVSSVAATATEPSYVQVATGTSMGAQAAVQSNAATTSGNISLAYMQITLGILSVYQTRVQLGQTTNCRVWIGVGGVQGQGSTMNSDSPITNAFSENLCMFRYSTAAGDTTWKCYVGTSGSSYSTVDSGIAPDTNGHIFQITFDGTYVNFYIDSVLVGQISSNVPATNVRMQDINYVDNLSTTTNTTLNTAYQYWETKV